MTDPLSDEIDEGLWYEASGRAGVIRRYLKENPGQTSAADIARLADELDLSRASVFRLIKLFREGGTLASLVERTQASNPADPHPTRASRWRRHRGAGRPRNAEDTSGTYLRTQQKPVYRSNRPSGQPGVRLAKPSPDAFNLRLEILSVSN